MESDQREIEKEYDRIAENLGLYPEFYEFVVSEFSKYKIKSDLRILDIGCGNGNLLKALFDRGYVNLYGIDLSERNIDIAQKRVPKADLTKSDINLGEINDNFDIIFMTEVVEHLVFPIDALIKVRKILNPNGYLFLTFPNKYAFFPLYYLNPIITRLDWWPGLRDRMRWFCLPYEMRSEQPVDNAYSPYEVRQFLNKAGFSINYYNGMRLWPMFRVPNWDWTTPLFNVLEKRLRSITPRILYYRYLFVCK